MTNIFSLALILFFFSQIVNAEATKTTLSFAELSNYVANLEKVDPYEVRRFFIKKDPSFKNGIVLLSASYNCGQGLCSNYVFAKNSAGTFDYVGIINGIFEESKENSSTPDFPDVWTQTKSAKEFELLKWSYNTKTQVYETK